MAVAKILVVDDDPDSLELFQRNFDRTGQNGAKWFVKACQTPQEALAELEKSVWDVVVTDIMMPEIDGYRIIAAARRKFPEIPCIAITGYGTVEAVKDALETGCFGDVTKPFDWIYLNDLVDKAIRCIQRYRRHRMGGEAGGGNAERGN